MKCRLYIFILIICNFLCVKNVLAAEEYLVKVRDSTAIVYNSATSYSTQLETLQADTIHTLLSIEKNGYYYKITTAGGTTGYIKTSQVVAFIDMNSDLSQETLSCVEDLEEKGFSESGYIPYLCLIQLQQPNWIFTNVDTGLDWDAAVTAESDCSSSVKSYIPLYDSQLDYYADYINKSCKNEYSSVWYPASYSAVSYHMDPRNFLSEDYIFQFESLLYDDLMSELYTDIVKGIIQDATFYSYNLSKGYDLSKLISEAGKETNVNPTFLASRILVELGTTTTLSGLYSGEHSGYTGYYNFINWGVTDSCATTSGATICGLEYAVKVGWSGIDNALNGAASVISENYISVGQYTTYFQKYNLTPTNNSLLYSHQYQTNIEAPSTEAWTTFSSYKTSGELDNIFLFAIPTFENMPALIEGEYVSNSGELNDEGISTLAIKNIITNSGYKYSNSYISGFEIGTLLTTIINNLENIAGTGNVVIYDTNNNVITTGVIKTGYKIEINNYSGKNTIEAVVYGDTSGDGEITALDLLQVQKNIVNLYTLSGVYKEAADTSKDGNVTALDLLQIQKNIVDLYTVEQ